jgi:hypothetical protein
MLNVIHAAEVQYRHESTRLDRELLLLARIAERTSGAPAHRHRFVAAQSTATPAVAAQPTATRAVAGLTVAARERARASWPRPISEHGRLAAPGTMAGAAVVCC